MDHIHTLSACARFKITFGMKKLWTVAQIGQHVCRQKEYRTGYGNASLRDKQEANSKVVRLMRHEVA